MNSLLLEILVCPKCKSSLQLSIFQGNRVFIESGQLKCSACNSNYEINEDIPHFMPDSHHRGKKNQQKTYSAWWDDFQDDKVITDPNNLPYFLKSLPIPVEDIRGKLVLDAGCGNGRFSFVVASFNPKLLVSFDLSSGVSRARKIILKNKPDANIAFVQGDLANPPFLDGTFGTAFSWGVLHHTPDPYTAFSIVSNLVADQGKFGTYLYEFHPPYAYNKHWLMLLGIFRWLFITIPLRALCSRLPIRLVNLLFLPVYHLEKALGFGIVGCHGYGKNGPDFDKRTYFLRVIDRFKSRYASEHQLEEIIGWFSGKGYNNLIAGTPKISIVATKTNGKKPPQLQIN